jgi:nucleotide-binding universal stress UspA family protein
MPGNLQAVPASPFQRGFLEGFAVRGIFREPFRGKTFVLHVLDAVLVPNGSHWSTTGDPNRRREEAQSASQKQFEQLICHNVPAATKLELLIKFGIPVEEILQACRTLKADLLILGLHHATHVAAASHLPWRAHEIVCAASCPVLTVKDSRDLAE